MFSRRRVRACLRSTTKVFRGAPYSVFAKKDEYVVANKRHGRYKRASNTPAAISAASIKPFCSRTLFRRVSFHDIIDLVVAENDIYPIDPAGLNRPVQIESMLMAIARYVGSYILK